MNVAEAPPAKAETARPTLATKVAWSGAASLFISLGGLGAGVIVARMLGAEALGQLAFLLWMVETVALVAQFGLTHALTRSVAENGDRTVAAWIVVRLLGLTLFGTAAFAILAPVLAKSELPMALHAAGIILFMVRAVETISRAWLAGTQDYRTLTRVNLVASGLWLPAVAGGALVAGLPGAVLGYAAASIVGCLPLIRDLHAVDPEAPRDGRVRRFAFWMWISAILAAIVCSRMEIVFLERWCTSAELGFFAVALRLAGVATAIPLMLSSAFLPHFAEGYGTGDAKSLREGYAAGTRFLALMLFPMALGLAAVTPVVLPMLYGAAFETAIPIAVVLAVGSCVAIGNIGSALIFGADRVHIRVRWAIPAAVLMLGMLVALVPEYGVWGAVWSRVTVQVLVIAISTIYVVRSLGVTFPLGGLARTFAAATVCGVGAAGLLALWPAPPMLVVAIPAGAALYLLCLRLFGAVHASDGAAFARFVDAMPRRIRGPLRAGLRFVGAGA